MEEKVEDKHPKENPKEKPEEESAAAAPRKNTVLALLLNPLLILGVVAVMAVAGMWAWKVAAVSAVESRIAVIKKEAAQATKVEVDKAVEDGKRALQSTQREKLMLFAKPLGWALRDLIVADNQSQINDYIAELMKQPGFDRIVLARVDGSIALASDSKLVDGRLEKTYPTVNLKATGPQVLDAGSGKLILVVPIIKQGEKLALLALTYDPAAKPPGMP